jgi:ribokinase
VTRIAITGYASLDHVAMLDGIPRPGRTTTILDRPQHAWPRLGGSPAYVAAALVANGVPDAFPVSWIGADEAGEDYRRQLARQHVPDEGLAVIEGARTPIAILAYEPNGGCLCLYHPGMPKTLGLTPVQRKLVADVDWVCVTIGPPGATQAVLETVGDQARLAWVVKHDPRAMPLDLAARVARRSDLIFCSRAEASFLQDALGAAAGDRPGRIIIETHGGSGALIKSGEGERFVAAVAMSVGDPTGAGDTFAGGALAAIAKGETDPAAVVEAGHRAARVLLDGRRIAEKESA